MNMSSATSNARFFGLDLQALRRELHAAWQQMRGWPIVKWLTPAVPVRVLRTGGAEAFWLAEGMAVTADAGGMKAARFSAIELPEDDLLVRTLKLPSLPAGEIAQAVALDVAGASPFPAEDLVWGHSTRQIKPGAVEVLAVLASRRQVQSRLQSLSAAGPGAAVPEVWAIMQGSRPIIFSGFGETRRLSYAAVRRRIAFALLLLALGLAVFMAATPTAQLRLRALEAMQSSEVLKKRTESLVRQRAALARAAETEAALKEILAQSTDPLRVMEVLTQALPDDTSLLGLQTQGSKVTINGMTVNAAALMQQLGARPEVRDVKAPTAATRPLGTTKDSFNIELTLAGRSASAAQAVAPAAPASAAGAAMPAASTPAVAAGTPTAATTPSSVQQGGASFGGASFGGSAQPQRPAGSKP